MPQDQRRNFKTFCGRLYSYNADFQLSSKAGIKALEPVSKHKIFGLKENAVIAYSENIGGGNLKAARAATSQ